MSNPNLLSRSLVAIDPSVSSVPDFQALSGISSRTVAKSILKFFAASGVGRLRSGRIAFSSADRLKAAMVCMRSGCDIRDVSAGLSWKDFELFASEILKSFGFRTSTNVRFVRPRMEIDVVGTRSSLALVVDCKHWSYNNSSAIAEYSRKQAARAARIVKEQVQVGLAVPLLVTLYSESVRFVDGIPVVPIAQFQSFVSEIESYLSQVCAIAKS